MSYKRPPNELVYDIILEKPYKILLYFPIIYDKKIRNSHNILRSDEWHPEHGLAGSSSVYQMLSFVINFQIALHLTLTMVWMMSPMMASVMASDSSDGAAFSFEDIICSSFFGQLLDVHLEESLRMVSLSFSWESSAVLLDIFQ